MAGTEKQYAVIGAGPAGLACVRNLNQRGLGVVGFELYKDVGGLWDIDNPHSTMYESAHLISSKRKTEFAEFPMKDDVAPYPGHAAMREYFRDYATRFGLYDRYQFETRVTQLRPAEDGWSVTTEHDGRARTERYAGVLIANGTLHTPNLPTFPGHFDGELLHSSRYRSASLFDGKQVLIVGCGNSACDIAVDAVHHARSVALSVRRGYYFIPKFIGGRPVDTLGGRIRLPRRVKQWLDTRLIRWVAGKPSDYGLPDPDYRIYQSHPVMNTLVLNHLGHGDIVPRPAIERFDGAQVVFNDGRKETYDLVLLATGYRLDYPFIDRAELNWQGDAPCLFLNIFHPRRNDLFVMGMVEATGLGWEGRNQQANLVSLYLAARAAGGSAAARLERNKADPAAHPLTGGYRYLKVPRMAYYVNKETYLATLDRYIRMFDSGDRA